MEAASVDWHKNRVTGVARLLEDEGRPPQKRVVSFGPGKGGTYSKKDMEKPAGNSTGR